MRFNLSRIILGIITLIGLGFLIRFLRKYPKVAQEGQDANQ
jgi:hypothetical protein